MVSPNKPPSPPPGSTDVFSLADEDLLDGLDFIKEIGFGNWGSVWLCIPKYNKCLSGTGNLANASDQLIAVKLVHREKTSTAAARVRSLWNEMKIVSSFKSDPHPSIIPFHSFVITPKFALITMTYIPTLIPVEVDEMKAREWFHFLLSAVEFLHKRGVVHNDIKPANILISHKNIPVLVDFGFAERYDLKSSTAFHSNLSYGTPQYLSPERARGLPHDTRKSDIWSLGVTFFEILIGRTPFEYSDCEQLDKKSDLERYWSRTLRGKWVGEWTMSKGMERMLRRMVAPNADLRCTSTQTLNDPYWAYRKDKNYSTTHRRSSSYNSSIVFERDMSKLVGEKLLPNPPGLAPAGDSSKEKDHHSTQIPHLTRAKSRTKVSAKKSPRKRAPFAGELSPIKGSPRKSPFSVAAGKENIRTFNAIAATATAARKPLGVVSPNGNLPEPKLALKSSRNRVLGDSTARSKNVDHAKSKELRLRKDLAKDRVREWEREKERMREMQRLEEIEREQDERREREEKEMDIRPASEEIRPIGAPVESPAPSFTTESSETPMRTSANHSSLSVFKHSIRKSIDKTVKLYKSSTIAQATGKSTPVVTLTADAAGVGTSWPNSDDGEIWEHDIFLHNAPSGLPSVQQAVRDERIAADTRMDRMSMWMRNVEKVVEDARQTFASSSINELTTLPSLPVSPLSRSRSGTRRSSRLPRKALAASQIFAAENNEDRSTFDLSMITGTYATADESSNHAAVESSIQLQIPEIHTPSRQRRRATVSICSPSPDIASKIPLSVDVEMGSPSKRREKSKSHGNLLQLHITPVSMLEAELDKPELPPSAHRLSQVLDSSLFIAPPLSPQPASNAREDEDMQDMSIVHGSASFNDLTSSPLHVEPYPPRKLNVPNELPLDTPSQRRVEGVYDRFLMATSGVKRLGKGYQSDNVGPVASVPLNAKTNVPRMFHSTRRRPMPPPVSSEDQRLTVSVDELGVIDRSPNPHPSSSGHTVFKDDEHSTAAFVRRAFKAIVPVKATSRRLSRIG